MLIDRSTGQFIFVCCKSRLRFAKICRLAEALGYRLDRVSGSHHIYEHPEASRPPNLQNVGGKAKAYQVRQFLRDIEEFHLTLQD